MRLALEPVMKQQLCSVAVTFDIAGVKEFEHPEVSAVGKAHSAKGLAGGLARHIKCTAGSLHELLNKPYGTIQILALDRVPLRFAFPYNPRAVRHVSS